MEKRSWFCTVFTQVLLCFAVYLALNLGQPQKAIYQNRALDLYFISVRGGFRPLKQQTHLLRLVNLSFFLIEFFCFVNICDLIHCSLPGFVKMEFVGIAYLMEKVAKTYKAIFVVNTSELGEDDPLMQNGTVLFPSLKVPWYTTRTKEGHGASCFLEQIKLPYGRTLDLIGVDTGSLQELVLTGSLSESGQNQLHWLTRTLEATNSNWRMVVGFHPLVVCEEKKEELEAKQFYEPLHRIFQRFGVNVYLSAQGCTNHVRHGNIAYIGNPTPRENESYVASVNGKSVFNGELVNGFLLHRVSSLEIVTYFISLAGEVVHRTVIQQRGKEVM